VGTSFDLDHPQRFTTGAVGEPGRRTFFLQAVQDGTVVSLKLEKQQVAALCEYLGGILADLPSVTGPLPDELDLLEPVVPEWVVGSLAVAYEEPADRIVLVAEEFVPERDDEEDEALRALADLVGSGPAPASDDDAPGSARFRLTRAQVLALVRHAGDVVAGGRPLCRLCGQPVDPAGHPCPRNN
jgi:uncharacterized repeat protein (TIGR03847 family)